MAYIYMIDVCPLTIMCQNIVIFSEIAQRPSKFPFPQESSLHFVQHNTEMDYARASVCVGKLIGLIVGSRN